MTPTKVLKASIKVCMFDQYGTIVDMQTGLTEIAGPYLESKGWKGNPNSFVTWWRRTHFENSMIDSLLGHAHTAYREIGHRSFAGIDANLSKRVCYVRSIAHQSTGFDNIAIPHKSPEPCRAPPSVSCTRRL
jgi:hypothetical protein